MRLGLHAIVAVVGVGLVSLADPALAQQATPRAWISLTLHEAVFQDKSAPGDPALILDLKRSGERWERVWGIASVRNAPIYSGRITSAKVDEASMQFSLELKAEQQSYASSARGKYDVSLTHKADGLFEGTYAGTMRGVESKGRAEARTMPVPPKLVPNYVPVQPGEHPRILFRKADLPRLRERMNTTFGRAAMEKMGQVVKNDADIVGMALKYQLSGDETYALNTIPFIEQLMARGHMSDQYGNNLGDRMERIALAYDMCYSIWPAEFKKRVEDYLLWGAQTVMFHKGSMNRSINWHVCSNWSAPIYTGLGFAGLALWGEKGLEPARPIAPNTGVEVPAAAGYVPGKGVPVTQFQDGEMPPDWIYVGGFKPASGEDPLEELGGAAKARPEVGTIVRFGDRVETFRVLSHEPDKGYWRHPNYMGGKDMIDITNAIGRVMFSTSFFYTVIQNDKPRWVQVATGHDGATVYLNGVPFNDGACANLEAGLYPVMVRADIGWTEPWGRIFMQPRLIEQNEEDVKELVASSKQEYEEQLKDWQYDVEEWRRLDGANVDYMKVYEIGRKMMYLHYREAVGTGGFQAEVSHYCLIANRGPARYAAAYRQMFGEDVSPYPDIMHFVPRKMFAHLYRGDGSQVAQEINGTPDITPDYFAALFPIVPAEWQPAVLWGWLRHAGVGEDEPITELLNFAPVYTFLYYPLEMKPQHPAAILPLAWEAPDFGYFGFRNSWEGKDDFITQVFLKARYIGGWNGPNAGTFRLMGLGHIWAYGPTDRNRCRWEENVVMLPDNPGINESACGRLAYLKTEKDGSGVLTIDMNDVYGSANPMPDGRAERLYEHYGMIRRPVAFKDSGITGLRAFGVDYSGLSGAPCLLVLVDKISGGGQKVWTWQLGGGQAKGKTADPGNLPYTKVEENTFSITKPDGATLRGFFVAPNPVTLTAEVKQATMIGGGGSTKGQTLERPIPGVFATGGDSFFVVVTVQRGEPPAVKVEGQGLGAKLTVGKRTISFDGQKIVFGQ